MPRNSSPYDACCELFRDYPQAIMQVNPGGTVRAMVVLVQDGDRSRFFALSQDQGGEKSSYSLWAWPAGEIVVIPAEGTVATPSITTEVVTRGIPIPRDGSLFGWTFGGVVTALIVVYSEYTREHPEPGWAVMPLAGVPEDQWPPFVGQSFCRNWSWEQHRAGRIIALDRLIAETPDTVFWVDTKAVLGSDSCAVAGDIRSPEGDTLRRGRYLYYEILRAGKTIPSLETFLACQNRIDLSLRFSGQFLMKTERR